MRGLLRTPTLAMAAAVAAAIGIYLFLTLPPAALELGAPLPGTIVSGAFHVHSNRSDGTGSFDDIAAAASRAGLHFVVVTDHGDGVRPPEPPSYRHGVLMIDAVEIATTEGHLVALGLTEPTPFSLAGHARDVIEDVHRLGGVVVAAHPDSPRPELRWRATGRGTAVDGIEWINVDSEWRDESSWRLIGAGIRSIVRSPESIAALLARPTRTLQRWDQAQRQRAVFSVAALDAHASIPWREGDEPRTNTALPWPSYQSMFETLVQNVVLERAVTKDAAVDSRQVVDALVAGRSYSVVRALAWPVQLEFSAAAGTARIPMGGDVVVSPDVRVSVAAAVTGAPGATVTLLHDGRPVASGSGRTSLQADAPGAYRVEVAYPGASVPWVVSNAIRLLLPGPAPTGPPDIQVAHPDDWHAMELDSTWMVEKESQSSGTIARTPTGITLRFALAPGEPRGQYAAMASAVTTTAGVDRIGFVGRADHPRRISVQFRLPGRQAQRWRHSAYLDTTPRTITLGVADFEPADGATSARPNVVPIASLLFVVDTVNTRPGTAGEIEISDIRLGIDRLRDPPGIRSGP